MTTTVEPTADAAKLRRALLALEKMQAKLADMERGQREPIAIIGLGCRFADADSPEAFWQMLRDGVDAVTEIPKERWDIDAYYDPDPDTPGKMYVRHGSFIENVDQFEPLFFGISPREAELMDPQQRLLLEVAWEAIERAGIAPQSLRGSATAVYVGMMSQDYAELSNQAGIIEAHSVPGNGYGMAAGRISHVLGLQGPNLSVDTQCSSSLVAVHLAVGSLRNRECNLALAGGVNLILSPTNTLKFCRTRAYSPEGRCKTFDARADGMISSEGCGLVLLKRLSDALTAGDPILAVIRGTAVNHDGASSGFTVPSQLAQEALLRQALANAQAAPEQIGYIEAHGTGTTLGDPIELNALGSVFGQRQQPLLLGSVKTNLGHTDSAAGVAGLIKTVLALRHGEIPPHLHFEQPTPHIPWHRLPFQVVTRLTPWPDAADGQKRLAGISSFGMSGTNAHVVVEEWNPTETQNAQGRPDEPQLLTLSAKTQEALAALAERYRQWLPGQPESALADICFTAHSGRNHFAHRLAAVGASPAELAEKLAAFAQGSPGAVAAGNVVSGSRPKIAFLFTGQGSQYVDMGRELYAARPVFRQTLDQCDAILRPLLGESILGMLYPNAEAPGGGPAKLDETRHTQPVLFALEYALAQLWLSWGVKPDVVLGHSVGEYVAACVAGVFSLEDGLQLIAARARLMGALPEDGGMAAALAEAGQVGEVIAAAGQVVIAAYNAPRSVVISGERQAVARAVEELQRQGVETRPLAVSHAFHSALMEPMLAEFEQAARQIGYARPRIPLISNVTGQSATDELAAPAYWARHIRQPVRFADSLMAARGMGVEVFLEIGPKPTLLGLARQCFEPDDGRAQGHGVPTLLPSLRPNRPVRETLLSSLGELYARGLAIDWAGFHRDGDPAARRRMASLPTYPFQRQRYWLPEAETRRIHAGADDKPLRPLLHKMMQSPLRQEIVFETRLNTSALPLLADHRVFDEMVISDATYLSMLLSAVEAASGGSAWQLTEVVFAKPIVLSADQALTLQLILTPENNPAGQPGVDSAIPFQIISFASMAPLDMRNVTTHVTGNTLPAASVHAVPWVIPAAFQTRSHKQLTGEELYADLKQRFHTSLGPSWQWTTAAWKAEGEALALIHVPPGVDDLQEYSLHPGLLGSLLYLGSAATDDPADEAISQPVAIEKVCLYRRPASETLWAHVRRTGEQQWEMQLFDPSGQVIAEVIGFEGVKVTRSQLLRQPSWQHWLYAPAWQAPTPNLPGNLPSPHEICAQLAPQLPTQLDQARLATYYTAIAGLETVSAAFIARALQQMGFAFQPQARWHTREIAQSMRVAQRYERLLARLLAALAEEGILQHHPDGGWEVIRTPAFGDLPALTDALANADPLVAAEAALLGRCAGSMAAVLQGAQDPLQLLFPDGDTRLATQLYQHSTQAQATSAIVIQAARQLLAQLPAGRTLRILEIGGGTGGTTAHLLPVLPAAQTEYFFTDLGPLFVAQAEEKFGAYPFVRYARLDIEHDPATQGFASGQYDVVVAANVLHATLDLRCTLQHVRQLLAPGGMLILVEETQRQRWVDLTFGLTDGWWRFQDLDLRPDYPLLGVVAWQTLLDATGFDEARSLTAAAGLACSEQVFLAQTPQATASPGRWLIFADAAGLGEQLATGLAAQGAEPVLVWPGTAYRQIDAHRVEIDPADPAGYRQLVAQAAALAGVAHLWSLDASAALSTEAIHGATRQGCHSVLHLAQALVEQGLAPRLWLITREAVDAVNGDAPLAGVAQAPLWGMGKTLALEHPELRATLVDLDAGTPGVEALLAEIGQDGEEDQIAWRAGARHIARLAPYPMQTIASKQAFAPQGNATYLISGGLGGLGLLVAGFLVERGAHHLVLLGRSAASASALAQIQTWEAAGATVRTVQADVADAEHVARIVAGVDPGYPLRGVVHAAGALDDGILLQQTPARFDRVLAAKVDGAWNLHQSTQGCDLDFFVLFSSNASLLGSAGQANHAAANQFLDAFAGYRQRLGLPGLSINWGVWSEVGAAAARMGQISLAGEKMITPATGIQIFAELLRESAAQIAVLPVENWPLFQQRLSPGRPLPLLAGMSSASAAHPAASTAPKPAQPSAQTQDLPARLAAADAAARQGMVEDYLRDCLRRVLNLDSKIELPPGQSWMELGMDSLLSIELSNRIKREAGVKISVSQLLDKPTIERIADLIQEHLTLQQIQMNKTQSPATNDDMEEMIL